MSAVKIVKVPGGTLVGLTFDEKQTEKKQPAKNTAKK